MKKIIYLTLMIVLVGTSLFMACKKEEPAPATNTTKSLSLDKIDKDLRLINAKYATRADKTTAPLGSAKAWATAGADLVAGGLTAWNTKELCATGWGGFVCGLLTVTAAGVASYKMYHGMSDIVHDGTTDHEKGIITKDVGTYVISNPYKNPCDSNGAQHNYWVKVLCEKTTDLPLTYSTLTFDSSDLTSDDLTAISQDTSHIAYNIAHFLSNEDHLVDTSGNISLTPLINYTFSGDTCMRNILTIFMEGFSQIKDVSSAMSFINDYENYFMNTDTGITDAEKNGLLNGFSIGKYSYAMWYDAFTN